MKKAFKIVLAVVLTLIVAVAGIGYGFIHNLAYPDAMVSGSVEQKVICIGDSITYGQGVLGSRDTDTYPAILAKLLCVAEQTGAQLIDLYSVTVEHSDWYSDGLHPNAEGNKAIAEAIYTQITAQ